MSSGKSKKKQKPLHEFGVNNLDNTAPIKTILEELQHKNPNAYRLYCQVLGKRPATAPGAHCTSLSHNIAAFPTDWDGDLPVEYFENFAYKSNLPKIISPAKYLSEKDPVTEYMLVKKEWVDLGRTMNSVASRHMDLSEGYKRLSEDVVRCSQFAVELAAHAQREPDPRFSCHYNWYYTGRGNMGTITLSNHRYLVHSELTRMNLTPFCEEKMEPNFDETISFDCGESHNILETTCPPHSNLIALRTMHKIFLLRIEGNEEPKFHTLKTLESKVAYTSIEFDPHHRTTLYVTSLDDTVDIVNLNSLQSKRVVLNKEPDFLNNWNTVQGFDRLHYVHATKDAIHVFDKRAHAKAYTIRAHKLVSEECNNISVVRKSERLPNCFYFGTNHCLFCVDVRSNSKLKPKLLSRWTHGMQCPPTYICVLDYEVGKELICLSSQWPEDTTFVVNDTAHLKADLPPASMVMPFKPLNVFDSLSEARSKKLCLDPTLHIDRRLSTAITGFLVLENDEKFDVYLQNSLGDISLQNLYPEHLSNFVRKEFSEELETWTQSLKVVPDKLQVTEVLDISAFWAFCRSARSSDSTAHKRRESRVKFSENEIVNLFNSEGFDDGLLAAWNVEDSKD